MITRGARPRPSSQLKLPKPDTRGVGAQVRLAAGRAQELGERVDAETQKMSLPGLVAAPAAGGASMGGAAAGSVVAAGTRRRYCSVRAGPHGPFRAGRDRTDASEMFVSYK